jgi:hypothetical protein
VGVGDSVITFNYDDALDRELKRAGKWDVLSQGYGFPFGNGDDKCDVPLLKLHGSINWLWNPFGGARAGGDAPSKPTLMSPLQALENNGIIKVYRPRSGRRSSIWWLPELSAVIESRT